MKFLHQHKGEGSPRHGGLREGLSFVIVIGLALLLAWGIITYIFESYRVDGPSMQNTLHNGDRLIVWKAPITWAKITGGDYIPSRGDIIIFKESSLAACGDPEAKQLVKRVIGLPGDHLVIKNGTVTIYDQQHPGGFVPKNTYPFGKHIPYTNDNGINVTLGKDRLFVMGDNRPNSCDSRTFGPINADQIVGKLVLRDWPIGDIKTF